MPHRDPARGHPQQRHRRDGPHARLPSRAVGQHAAPSTASTASGSSTASSTSTQMARMVGTVPGRRGDGVPAGDVRHTPRCTPTRTSRRNVRDMAAVGGRRRDHPVGDEAGVLPSERRGRAPARMGAAAGDVPLEMHFHNTTGLRRSTTSSASRPGIRIVHTAVGPAGERPVHAVDRGHRSTTCAVAATTRTIDSPARSAGRQTHFARGRRRPRATRSASPAEYRWPSIDQQLPGGMTGTLRNQLAHVRHGGSPRGGAGGGRGRARGDGLSRSWRPRSRSSSASRRCSTSSPASGTAWCPDENLIYLAGHLGPHPAPVDPEVLDRALGSPRGRQHPGLDRRRSRASREIRARVRRARSPTRSCSCATSCPGRTSTPCTPPGPSPSACRSPRRPAPSWWSS